LIVVSFLSTYAARYDRAAKMKTVPRCSLDSLPFVVFSVYPSTKQTDLMQKHNTKNYVDLKKINFFKKFSKKVLRFSVSSVYLVEREKRKLLRA